MTDLVYSPISELAPMLRARQISPVELTRAFLERIERLNPALNCYITVTSDVALAQAHQAEQEIVAGKYRGPLHGIPIALKDLIETSGILTSAGSGVLKDNLPKSDAEVARRLRHAGAVLLGKLNLHEFAYGGSGVISFYGVVTNPWNQGYITGGSSSGSGAAVAAGLCCAALGTDTAGSIRLPASCCGIVGFKPSYGMVSTAGVIPLSWSYDHVGPMTRTVTDAAILLDVLAGYDARDSASREYPAGGFADALAGTWPGGLRIGLARSPFFDDLDPQVDTALDQAVKVLSSGAGRMQGIGVPELPDRTVATTEAYAYHLSNFLPAHESEYQSATLQRILSGQRHSAAEYVMKKRELDVIRRTTVSMLKSVDVVVCPTCPILPPTFAALAQNIETLRPTELMMLRNTRPFNVLGWPAISVPCGFSSDGVPIGLQIAAAPGHDELVLRAARFFEQETQWHKPRPHI